MKEQIEESEIDTEAGHAEADGILTDLLRELGFAELVELYEKVQKWYA